MYEVRVEVLDGQRAVVVDRLRAAGPAADIDLLVDASDVWLIVDAGEPAAAAVVAAAHTRAVLGGALYDAARIVFVIDD